MVVCAFVRPSIFVMSSRTIALKPVLVGSLQEMPTMAEFGSGVGCAECNWAVGLRMVNWV